MMDRIKEEEHANEQGEWRRHLAMLIEVRT
jgi:hypothetical protein